MSLNNERIDELVQENTILKKKVDKLISELAKQLETNFDNFLAMREKDQNIAETSQAHNLLQGAGKMLEERYMLMAENINKIVTIVDLKGKYIYVNHKAAEFHGKNAEDMIGKSIFGMYDRAAREKYRREIFKPVTEENRECISSNTFKNKNGKVYVEAHGMPIHDGQGKVIGLLNIVHDVTADKKKSAYISIEQSINLITSFSGGLEKTITDVFVKLYQADCIFAGGLYLLNEDRQMLELTCHYNLPDNFISNNRSFEADTLQFEIVMRGKPQYDILPELPDEIRREIERMDQKTISVIPLVHENQVLGCLNLILNDFENITSDDKSFIEAIVWRIARMIDLHDAQVKLNRTVEQLNQTISDLKIKQQMLIHKSKMESLGELSAGMAHEINQPLVIISLSIENIMQKMIMGRKDLSTAYLQRKFQSMLLNVNRIQQVVDNMRIFAQDHHDIVFKKVNIRELVSKTLEMVSVQFRAEGIKIVSADIDSKAHIVGNIFKMEQVLLNLMTNSRYAVIEKFKKTNDPGFQKQIEIKATKSANSVILDVSDNGIGISEEHIEKLFTPFFTTKREGAGSGLGLSIVYGIVKEMNGSITVTSDPGEYTNVRIVLPAV